MTLQEIADIEGLSKQRIAEILNSAMKKFRKACLEKGLEMEDIL